MALTLGLLAFGGTRQGRPVHHRCGAGGDLASALLRGGLHQHRWCDDALLAEQCFGDGDPHAHHPVDQLVPAHRRLRRIPHRLRRGHRQPATTSSTATSRSPPRRVRIRPTPSAPGADLAGHQLRRAATTSSRSSSTRSSAGRTSSVSRTATPASRSPLWAPIAASAINLGDNVGRGYITIDTVNQCSTAFAFDPGYFVDGGAGIATAAERHLGRLLHRQPG